MIEARVRVEITAAPSCEPSILARPPRLRRDAQGFLRRELKGHDGWSDQGVVEDVTRLASHGGLVLVATDVQAFLMAPSDFDTLCWTDRAGLTTRHSSSSQRA